MLLTGAWGLHPRVGDKEGTSPGRAFIQIRDAPTLSSDSGQFKAHAARAPDAQELLKSPRGRAIDPFYKGGK